MNTLQKYFFLKGINFSKIFAFYRIQSPFSCNCFICFSLIMLAFLFIYLLQSFHYEFIVWIYKDCPTQTISKSQHQYLPMWYQLNLESCWRVRNWFPKVGISSQERRVKRFLFLSHSPYIHTLSLHIFTHTLSLSLSQLHIFTHTIFFTLSFHIYSHSLPWKLFINLRDTCIFMHYIHMVMYLFMSLKIYKCLLLDIGMII